MADDQRGLVGQQPSRVSVTVLKQPSGLTPKGFIFAVRRHAGPAAMLLLALAAVVSIAVATLTGHGTVSPPAQTRAASGFPLHCVSVAIALHDPRFIRADFDRTLRCEHIRASAHARSWATAGWGSLSPQERHEAAESPANRPDPGGY
jgi:hypothetical protein